MFKEISMTRGTIGLIDPDRRRMHLGWPEEVTPSDEGVRVLRGIWFNSDELQEALENQHGYARNGQRGKVTVYIDPDCLTEATVALPRHELLVRVHLQCSAFADLNVTEALNLMNAYRTENPETTEIHERRLAEMRRDRSDFLDKVAVENGLSAAYLNKETIQAKARAAFRGSRIIGGREIDKAVAPGQILADNPAGKFFDFTDGKRVIEGVAASPAADENAQEQQLFSQEPEPQLTDDMSDGTPKQRNREKRPEAAKMETFARPAKPTSLK